MIRLTKFLFVLILTALVFTSCDPASKFKTEIAQIDSCLVEIDSLEQLYDGIDFDSLRMMVDHVRNNEQLIKKYYIPDTLNEEFGRQMNDAKSVRKSLKNLDKHEMTYGDEINAVKHQFLDLKEDILNGLFDKEQIKKYLDAEIVALKKVDLAFTGFHTMIEAEKFRYNTVVPEIDAFIAELKANSEIEVVE